MENWLPVVGYEEYYEVSDCGRVRSLERIFFDRRGARKHYKSRILKTAIKDSYPEVTLCINYEKDRRRVHDLMAAAFIGPRPSGMYVCHNDGVKDNNKINNLRYDTPGSNSVDTIYHGGRSYTLSVNDVLKIRNMSATMSGYKIARMFGVNSSTIYAILHGKRWSHVGKR
jgi:hypothetical protein